MGLKTWLFCVAVCILYTFPIIVSQIVMDLVVDENELSVFPTVPQPEVGEDQGKQLQEVAGPAQTTVDVASQGYVAPQPFGFLHGVASGDPTTDSVVIWTRWTPPFGQDLDTFQQNVQYQVAVDSLFQDVVDFGVVTTNIDRDFTVKFTVEGLMGGTTYYYKFQASGRESRIGKTRTLPEGQVEQLRFAVFSGANWRRGFFNAYGAASKVKELDFMLHLGDFIFESSNLTNPTPDEYVLQDRPDLEPGNEVASLEEYRLRHALYRTDKGLQDLLATVPMFCAWDDHEVVQGAYKSGAQEHDVAKGLYEIRKQFAMQAYQEWMPIQFFRRDLGDTYREFYFGELAVLVLPETRLTYRDAPVDILRSPLGQQIENLSASNWTSSVTSEAISQLKQEINKPGRVMIGETQMGNIEYTARLPGAIWYLLGSQTSVGQTACADFEGALDVLAAATRPTFKLLLDAIKERTVSNEVLRKCFASGLFDLPHDTDAWSGYPEEREQLIAALDQKNDAETGRSVVFSGNGGDSAVLKVNNLEQDPVAVEFLVPSVTSPGFEFVETIANETFLDLNWENWFIAAKQLANPGMIYYNLGERGFAVVTIEQEELHVDYVYVSTVESLDYGYKCRAAFDVFLEDSGDVRQSRCTRESDLFEEQ
eukprot:TRINITY_DN23216_c0_g3_i1.p1 TRINITY_DN23216_c0_g3~~TRINITY_DN23216_c0_g3_i1.p1  ORF type:complete len:650 (+),score=75.46 TRINITY_DN23216_c0_g3_i1:61-2010(+)